MAESSSKWKDIAQELSSKIRTGEWPVGYRVESEADIARGWGVSRPTAHRAMAELQREGLVIRQRRNGTVVAEVRKKRTQMVALLFDHMAKQFDFPQAELIQGIQEGLGKEFSLVWCDSMDDPHREADFLRRMSAETDGIICFPIADPVNTPIFQGLVRHRVPLVLLDRVLDGCDGVAIISEDRETTRQSINLLGSRGHRRIGFLGFHKPSVSSANARFEGYLAGMRDLGIEDSSRFYRWFVRHLEHEPDLLRQAVRDSLVTLLKYEAPLTAIYCAQDSFAAELVNVCDELGIRIPDDLEVVVVNEWPRHLLKNSDRMDRIVRRKRMIGTAAAQRLLGLRAGEVYEDRILAIPAELHTPFPQATKVESGTDSSSKPSLGEPMEVKSCSTEAEPLRSLNS
jgi:LacI family transcriptional regulator